MGKFKVSFKVTALITVLLAIRVAFYFKLNTLSVVPEIGNDFWKNCDNQNIEQGGNKLKVCTEDTKIYPFKVSLGDNILKDFRDRLERELETFSRLSPTLKGTVSDYGINSQFLFEIGQYWLNSYNWTQRQQLLNKYPHYQTQIGGLDIHFQHIKPNNSAGKAVRPIVLLNGWPESFAGFQKIIPLLLAANNNNANYTYSLVIPALPGYCFSDAAELPGMSPAEMANIIQRLMQRLQYSQYFVVASDWGSMVAADLAVLYPQNVIAVHSNLCVVLTVKSIAKYLIARALPFLFLSQNTSVYENAFSWKVSLVYYLSIALKETGYFHLQATKPDTVGVALTHSPLGLAAYMLEKIAVGTDFLAATQQVDGGLLTKFSQDELLDNVMIYYSTASILSASRIYAEYFSLNKRHHTESLPTNVPYSCQYMSKEIAMFPEFVLRDKFTNLQKFTVEPRGGHFAAWEEPQLVAEKALSFFASF